MPINNWLSPYTMEPSSKTPSLPTTTTAAAAAAAAALWASPAAAVFRPHTAAFRLNLNNEDDGELLVEDERPPPPPAADGGGARHHLQKEPLFEKPLTPSDVGKLNRLVIPKQHAEKYFPLNAAGGGGGGGEKGLLLGFEDEAGKAWRFRYSYWNSSQSYVLTKGWSRFVKEKRLEAGDIVLFARHPDDLGRLFIGWRRRNGGGGENGGVAPPPGGGWSGLVYTAHPYPTNQSSNSSVLYQTECPHAENHVKGRNGNSKRLRLFGVNLEWDDDVPEPEPELETSTSGSGKGQVQEEPYHEYYSSHRGSGHTVSYVCDSTNI